jgi:outer membrane receptor for ferrienterochelin and colicins
VAAVLAGPPGLGSGQSTEDDPARLADLDIEQLVDLEVETTRTASKYEQRLSRAPSSITVVTAEEIRDLGYRTLADVLRGVRGLFVTYDRQYSYLGFRGFDRPGDYNTRILLLVDGHQVNDDIFDQAFLGTDFLVDLDLVDRVEIVRGPGSSLYGGNALFGVINVITRRPVQSGAEVSAEAGSFGSFRARLTYGLSHPSGLETLLSVSGFASAGQDLHSPDFDGTPSGGWARGLDWDQSGSFLGKMSYQGLSLEIGGIRRDKSVPTAPYDTLFGDPRNQSTDSRLFVELKYEQSLLPDFQAMARLYFDEYFYAGRYPFAADTTHPSTYLNKDDITGRWIGAETRGLTRIGDALTLVAGGEVKRHFQQDQRNFDEGGETILDDHRQSTVWALYAQAESALGTGLQLDLGARYDHYDTFGGTLNPRAALIYNPWPSTTLKAIYGRAFRPPNLYELYYYQNSFSAAGPPLRPEILHTEELVLEQQIGRSWRLTIDAYLAQVFDLVGWQSEPGTGLFAFRNMGSVHAMGLEGQLEHRWPGGFSARLSYAIQRTQDDDTRDVLTNSPTHLAKLQLRGPLFWPELRGGLELLYVGSRQTLAGSEASASLVANATVLLAGLLGGKLDITASVYNLFDTSYADPGSAEHRMDLIQQDGRSLRLKAIARF